MSLTVCLGAYTLRDIKAGAYHWAFLNWALGLKSLGCRVIWLDSVVRGAPIEQIRSDLSELKGRLEGYGAPDEIAVIYQDGADLPSELGCPGLSAALQADLFLNLGYDLAPDIVKAFRRSAFIDIDPGLTQTWMNLGQLEIAPHDIYFTYGETVGQSAQIPKCGFDWHYTPPPVFLPVWNTNVSLPQSTYTTVSSWWGDQDWIEIEARDIDNSKRTAFMEYLKLPSQTSAGLELALPLSTHERDAKDREILEQHGWRVRHVNEVSATPEMFQSYVQHSRGEFSCMKRGYVLLQTAWTSERTLNYLASGKPAIVQNTGPSRFLPEAEGLFRFKNLAEAGRALDAVERDYEKHSHRARALAEEYFDSQKVIPKVLERALD